jgi:hypothetical protein
MKRNRKFNLDDHIISPTEAEELLASDDLCGYEVGSDEMAIAKVLLFSMWVGEDDIQLAAVSAVPLPRVREISEKLRSAKVFGAGLNHRSEYMAKGGSIALSCDIACGMGQLRRSHKDGKAAWQMTDAGLEHVESTLLAKPAAQKMMGDLQAAQGLPREGWKDVIGKSKQAYFCPKCKYVGSVLIDRHADVMSVVYAIALDHESKRPQCDQIPTGFRARAPQCSDEEWNKVIGRTA